MPWRSEIAEMLGCVQVPRNPWMQGLMQLDGWQDLVQYPVMGKESFGEFAGATANNGASENVNCRCPGDALAFTVAPMVAYAPEEGSLLSQANVREMSSSGFRKRKAEKPQTPMFNSIDVADENDEGDKKVKCEGGGAVLVSHRPKQEITSSNTNSAKETSADNSKQSISKPSEVVQKLDYIHVRARRGQATDSHSLAERARREKISERMKYLQDIVPGCNKITGKAGMLDEIINYVQSLQRQVEFLSMKLAAANPVLDLSAHEYSIVKENISGCSGGIPLAMSIPSDLMSSSHGSASPIQLQTSTANCGLGLTFNPQDVALYNRASDPVTLHDFVMEAHFNVAAGASSPAWNTALQNLLIGDFNHANETPNCYKVY